MTPDSSYNSVRDDRFRALQQWLKSRQIPIQSLEPASADASTRRYYRLASDGRFFIVMDDPPAGSTMHDFILINQRLADSGCNVPEIFQYCESAGFMVLEDFGQTHYLQAIHTTHGTGESRRAIYEQAMSSLAKIQRHADSSSLPHYSRELITTEMGLFVSWYVERHLGRQLSPRQLDSYNAVIELCCREFEAQPQCFVHRDYHSRNLMLTRCNAPGILDHQGAVLGPITYDVASLLRDCYYDWPEDFVEHFCRCHRRQLDPIPSEPQYRRWFDFTGLQRHLKVLGIFARLWHRDGKQQYLADLPLVLRHVNRVVVRYPELRELGSTLNALTQP